MLQLTKDADERQSVHVGQSSHSVSGHPSVMMTTVLGSCIAACLHDPVLKIGGMNHFLLPRAATDTAGDRMGVHLMELLVNDLMKLGCRRQNLVAKVFGGANIFIQGSTVGERNIRFVRSFLADEGIACIAESLGGDRARLVRFWPCSGRAMQMRLAPTDDRIGTLADERPHVPPRNDDADELWG